MIDTCPSCDRRFEGIVDFPLVKLVHVSVLNTTDVPAMLSHWYQDDLLEKEIRGWNRELVPTEVLAYFSTHPDIEEMAHSDGFVYGRPYEERKKLRGLFGTTPSSTPQFWNRSLNYTPLVKRLLEDDTPVRAYFQALGHLVGQEVSPVSRVMPAWDYNPHFHVYEFPSEQRFSLSFDESPERVDGHRVSEINLRGPGPNRGRAGGTSLSTILKLGSIRYEGRVHSKE